MAKPLLDHLINKLNTFPLGRIYLITIKDNTQSTKWVSIGKINDWIRRYSNNYYIVRGMNGGIHFHILAGIKPNQDLKPYKNIHFHMRNLKKDIMPMDDTILRETQRCIHLSQTIRENIIEKLKIPEVCKIISTEIKKHFEKKHRQVVHKNKKSEKYNHIERILNYLDKNLDEPRDGDTQKYRDYVLQT